MGLSLLTCNMVMSSESPHRWVIKGLFETVRTASLQALPREAGRT